MENKSIQRNTTELEFISLFSFLTMLTALSIDAILPGVPDVARDLSAGQNTYAYLIISILVLGMAVGEPVFGPLADVRGRKTSVLVGIFIFIAGSGIAAMAQSFEVLLLGRFIQGVGVAGPKIGSRAAIRDRYDGRDMARVMSIVMSILILVPMIAPMLGELVMKAGTWRTIFVAYVAVSVVGGLWLHLRQPETLKKQNRITFNFRHTWKTAISIATDPRVLACTVSAGLIFGCLIGYYGIAPSVFHDIYNTGKSFTLLFAVLASSIGIATLVNSRLVVRYGMYRLTKIALTGLIISSTCLLTVSFAQLGAPPLPAFMLICFACFFSIGILFGNLGAMAMEPLGAVAGIGASVIASLSSAVAVTVSMVAGFFYHQTLVPFSISLLCSAAVSLWLVNLADKIHLVQILPVQE